MTSDRFRSVALILRSYISDTYNLLDAADAIVAGDPYPTPDPVRIPDAVLFRIAQGNDDVCEAMRQGKRINAIKALRALFAPATGERSLVGLKEAKEACEGERWEHVYDYYARMLANPDPWAVPFQGSDEPPF